jgi:hypothetical protein
MRFRVFIGNQLEGDPSEEHHLPQHPAPAPLHLSFIHQYSSLNIYVNIYTNKYTDMDIAYLHMSYEEEDTCILLLI